MKKHTDMKHHGTSAFETGRLICRRFSLSDCMDMLENWISDPDIQHEYGEPAYSDESSVMNLLKNYIEKYHNPEFYRWAVIEKTSRKNIGQIAFCRVYSDCATAEIEYCIGKKFWGMGYAGEALSGLVDYIFANTEFQRLEAYHRTENFKSGRVLEKSELHRTENVERFSRKNIIPKGEVCYCIRRSEYSGRIRI